MTLDQKSTLSRGIIAETAVVAHLTRSGFAVSLPVSGHSPYDLIAENHKYVMRRVQVKFSSARNDCITVYLNRVHTNSKGAQSKPINLDAIDAFAVFCPQTEKVYYIPKWELGGAKTCFVLRLGLDKRGLPRRRINKAGKSYMLRKPIKRRMASEFTDPKKIFQRRRRSDKNMEGRVTEMAHSETGGAVK